MHQTKLIPITVFILGILFFMSGCSSIQKSSDQYRRLASTSSTRGSCEQTFQNQTILDKLSNYLADLRLARPALVPHNPVFNRGFSSSGRDYAWLDRFLSGDPAAELQSWDLSRKIAKKTALGIEINRAIAESKAELFTEIKTGIETQGLDQYLQVQLQGTVVLKRPEEKFGSAIPTVNKT
jgi:hypothetical protein